MSEKEQDFVAVGYNTAGTVGAFTTGTWELCQAAAKVYRRLENGSRVYPVVHVMPSDKWYAEGVSA